MEKKEGFAATHAMLKKNIKKEKKKLNKNYRSTCQNSFQRSTIQGKKSKNYPRAMQKNSQQSTRWKKIQESPFQEQTRVWVKNYSNAVPWTSACVLHVASFRAACVLLRLWLFSEASRSDRSPPDLDLSLLDGTIHSQPPWQQGIRACVWRAFISCTWFDAFSRAWRFIGWLIH